MIILSVYVYCWGKFQNQYGVELYVSYTRYGYMSWKKRHRYAVYFEWSVSLTVVHGLASLRLSGTSDR